MPRVADLVLVGASAAGLATAIFAARRNPRCRIVALDGAQRLGAKILIAGGGRCNVTHARVSPADYCGGSRNAIARILRAFTVEQTVAFFAEIGVPLHEERWGKLFPDSNDGRTVLAALLNEARRRGVDLRAGQRVAGVTRCDAGGFAVQLADGGRWVGQRVVLATGGMALPKSGSDGAGYGLAIGLGHTLVATTPALAPLVLDGDFHPPLSGVSHDAELTIRSDGERPVRIRGPLLWTHFGISGPVALDASRHWLRSRLVGRPTRATLSFLPGQTAEAVEERMIEYAAAHPAARLSALLDGQLPTSVANRLLERLGAPRNLTLAHLPRELRRRMVQALLEWPLPIRDSRGYTYAEATAGGVPLSEVETATMESRVCPGLHLVGEILDVDGRIGGFNFQWAWSSGFVAGNAIAAALATAS